MSKNIEKFRKTSREKGILAAILKTVSYLVFVARKSRLQKIWDKVSLKSGRLEVRGWNTGPKIYWDGLELTKGIGLNTSIFVNGRWHDSSKADWKPAGTGSNTLTLKNRWSSLPISQTWVISNLGDGKIACETKLEAEKDIEFIEQKYTIMISDKFNLWLDETNKATMFPQFKDWVDIKEVKKDSPFIGAQSNIDRKLPTIIMRRQDFPPKVFSQIQNSDFKTEARLLNFVASSRDMRLKYKKGSNAFFKMEIYVR